MYAFFNYLLKFSIIKNAEGYYLHRETYKIELYDFSVNQVANTVSTVWLHPFYPPLPPAFTLPVSHTINSLGTRLVINVLYWFQMRLLTAENNLFYSQGLS